MIGGDYTLELCNVYHSGQVSNVVFLSTYFVLVCVYIWYCFINYNREWYFDLIKVFLFVKCVLQTLFTITKFFEKINTKIYFDLII